MIIWEHGEDPSYTGPHSNTYQQRSKSLGNNVAGAASPNNLRLHRERAASKYVHPVYRRSHKLSHLQTDSATALSRIYIVCCFFSVKVQIECWLWLYLEIDMPLIQNSDFFLCYNFLLWGFFDWTKNQNKTNIDTYIYQEKFTFFFKTLKQLTYYFCYSISVDYTTKVIFFEQHHIKGISSFNQ